VTYDLWDKVQFIISIVSNSVWIIILMCVILKKYTYLLVIIEKQLLIIISYVSSLVVHVIKFYGKNYEELFSSNILTLSKHNKLYIMFQTIFHKIYNGATSIIHRILIYGLYGVIL